MSRVNKRFGSLTVDHLATLGQLSLDKTSMTQATAITSGVTLNAPSGFITTVSTTLATNGSASFSVTNDNIKASSMVLANIVDYTGSNGIPSVIVDNITTGSFSVVLRNSHINNPLNGAVKLGFLSL